MKILTVSDIVDNRIYNDQLKNNFQDIDLILSAGDLPYSYLEYIVSVLNKPLLYVKGNHQNTGELLSNGQVNSEPMGCINVHGKVVFFKGLLIGGLEGCLRYNKEAFQYTELQMRGEISRMLPFLLYNKIMKTRYIDILLTHAAPFGLGDVPGPVHSGFKAFLEFMDAYQPRLHVHGHVHLYDRNLPFIHSYKKTTIVNTYGYRVIEFENIDQPGSLRIF